MEQPAPLTRHDIAALREAGNVWFRATSTGRGLVTATLELRDSFPTRRQMELFPELVADGWRTERRRSVVVTGRVSGKYPPLEEGGESPRLLGTHWVSSARFDRVWRTIASLLRPDDTLHLSFGADRHRNGYLSDAGLHADSFELHVHRRDERLVFPLSSAVSADNTARMVVPEGSWTHGTTTLDVDRAF